MSVKNHAIGRVTVVIYYSRTSDTCWEPLTYIAPDNNVILFFLNLGINNNNIVCYNCKNLNEIQTICFPNV